MLKETSYTTHEESEFLEKILPKQTADLAYRKFKDTLGDRIDVNPVNFLPNVNNRSLPCWSTGALIDMLPSNPEWDWTINPKRYSPEDDAVKNFMVVIVNIKDHKYWAFYDDVLLRAIAKAIICIYDNYPNVINESRIDE